MSMRAALVLLAGLMASPASAATLEEFGKADAAAETIWLELPLSTRVATFVKAPSGGFGMYEPRGTGVFKPGEPILSYMEPVGFGWKPVGDGLSDMGFTVDMAVMTETGEIIGGQKNFAELRKQTRRHNREFAVDLTLTLNGAPAGKYIVEYVLHDIASDKAATVALPFEIRP